MSGYVDVLPATALAVLALMLVTWAVSVLLRDASIVDIVWGLGFVLVAWVSFAIADGTAARRVLLTAMTTIWGLRLTLYLLWRNWGRGEDPRYVAMRRHWGERFWLISLGTVFLTQGALMWVISLPVQVGQVPTAHEAVGLAEVMGLVVWGVGMVFETVGDAQLARFKSDPDNAGAVMDRGLWRYTRHPNYFGDFCVWWGIFLVAAATGVGLYTIVSPIIMTVLLQRVSGVPLLERSMAKRRPGYAEYVQRTNAFFPGPPSPDGRDAGS